MSKNRKSQRWQAIPTHLTLSEFNEFIWPYLSRPARFGPQPKVSAYKTFNYILKFLYLGCQWASLPIDQDDSGQPEIHYTTVFRRFKEWVAHDIFQLIFESTVLRLSSSGMLDTSVLHGDGTTTAAKKGGIIWVTVVTNI